MAAGYSSSSSATGAMYSAGTSLKQCAVLAGAATVNVNDHCPLLDPVRVYYDLLSPEEPRAYKKANL